jgi:hypothetical protein
MDKMKEALAAIEGLTFADCVRFFAAPDSDPHVSAASDIYHCDGEVEVDDITVLSEGDDAGCYVMAWVWVSDDDASETDEGAKLGDEDDFIDEEEWYMSKITLQDIFNAAWQAFIVEDRKPAFENLSCRYLTDDGRRCAVGLCIPDGHPAQLLAMSFDQLALDYPELFDVPDDCDLDTFQNALHDELIVYESGEWFLSKAEREQAYRLIAAQYNLTVPQTPES